MTDRAPGSIRVVLLVAAREIRERLRTRSYPAMTALVVIMIIAIGFVGRIAGSDDEEPVELGIVGAVSASFVEGVEQSADLLGLTIEIVDSGDPETTTGDLDRGTIDAAVLVDRRQLLFAGDVDDEVVAVVQQAWSSEQLRDGLAGAGLSPTEVDEVLSPARLEVITVDGDGDAGEDDDLAVLTGTIVSIMLFVSLQTFGSYVLMGVVEEKSTAVVELLLARLRADQLLGGKIVGIGATALLQFMAAALAGVVSLAISGTDVPTEIWTTVPIAIVWFLGGYAFYSTLYGLAGSLVSRQEDAQAASAPILTVMVGAYLAVFVLGYAPDSTASTVLSMIPPFAPFLMPMRMAAGAASTVEVVMSLILLAVAIVGVWRLAGAIYAQVLLRRGTRIGWREALHLLRSPGRALG